MWALKKDGKEIFRGTNNACYIRLQKAQPQSADWAMKHEGWTVEDMTEVNMKNLEEYKILLSSKSVIESKRKSMQNQISKKEKQLLEFMGNVKGLKQERATLIYLNIQNRKINEAIERIDNSIFILLFNEINK